MNEWWAKLMPRLRKHPAGSPVVDAAAGTAAALADSSLPPAGDEPAETAPALFAWLVDAGLVPDAALAGAEADALDGLQALVRHGPGAAELLPRAPAVIPQLLSMLRHDDRSLAVLSQRVAADVMLSAEVIRQAHSAAHAHRREPSGRAIELPQALALLGVDGLKAVIARVVLRPLFDGQAGRFAAAAPARVRRLAECQAQHAAALAAGQGLDPFDGYLGGLVHGTGWTVAFRALDRRPAPPAPPFSQAFAQRLVPLADALFGKVVADWRLTPALTTLCRELRGGAPLDGLPLGAVLQQARHAAALDLVDGGDAAG